MRFFSPCLIVLALAISAHAQFSTSALPGARWQKTTPEDAGWDLDQTHKVNDYLNEIGVTVFVRLVELHQDVDGAVGRGRVQLGGLDPRAALRLGVAREVS